MSEWDNSRGDVLARGNAMAHGAILTATLHALISKGVLTADDVETMLTDIVCMFQQPMATDHQLVASERTRAILENVLNERFP